MIQDIAPHKLNNQYGQKKASIIKAFARIDRIDEFNQGNFTICPLQQFTVYYGGEFKMQFV